MVFAKISQVAHYTPEQIVTNDDLSQMMETSDEWIHSRTGISQRHISQSESTSDLATKVALDLLTKAECLPSEIDFILVATITPDSIMPSTAARVQANIGANNAFAFDLAAACSGFVFALAMADKLVQSGLYKKGLVIGAETLSKVVDWKDRRTAILFGDGAGGILIEASNEKHFLAESLYTDGLRGSGLTSTELGLTSPFSEQQSSNSFLTMDGRSIFDFAVRDVSKSIRQLIDASNIEDSDINYLLLHQANVRILDKMSKKMSLPRTKFLSNVQNYGNTSAASIPILLSESVEKGLIKLDGSQLVVLSGFGGGLTWGNLIVKI